MEFGLHIADYTWTTGPEQLGPSLARHVRNAEAAGIQRITVAPSGDLLTVEYDATRLRPAEVEAALAGAAIPVERV